MKKIAKIVSGKMGYKNKSIKKDNEECFLLMKGMIH